MFNDSGKLVLVGPHIRNKTVYEVVTWVIQIWEGKKNIKTHPESSKRCGAKPYNNNRRLGSRLPRRMVETIPLSQSTCWCGSTWKVFGLLNILVTHWPMYIHTGLKGEVFWFIVKWCCSGCWGCPKLPKGNLGYPKASGGAAMMAVTG